ncbi:MAG: hypothetical protein AAFU61_11610, partial [Pseudomonadota bacterium]
MNLNIILERPLDLSVANQAIVDFPPQDDGDILSSSETVIDINARFGSGAFPAEEGVVTYRGTFTGNGGDTPFT